MRVSRSHIVGNNIEVGYHCSELFPSGHKTFLDVDRRVKIATLLPITSVLYIEGGGGGYKKLALCQTFKNMP